MVTPEQIESLREAIQRAKDASHCLSLPGDPAWPIEQERKANTQRGIEQLGALWLPALLSQIESDRAEILALREALRPFAAITPSSLYPADGSENEPYCILIAPQHGNPVEFGGLDLARARRALSPKEPS